MTDRDNRDYITAVETISAAGTVIPPIVILAAKQIRDTWAANGIEDDAQIGVSDSGSSNDDLALEWQSTARRFPTATNGCLWLPSYV